MEITEKQLQPLLINQHVDSDNFRHTAELNRALNRWSKIDLQTLQLDEKPYYNAIQWLNLLGYNYDEVLSELIAQMPNHTDELSIKLPKRYEKPLRTPKELIAELYQYGHKPQLSHENRDRLVGLEVTTGICTIGQFLNAVTYQIIVNKNHHIDLKIGQDSDTQNAWKLLSKRYITGDYPKEDIGQLHI